MSDKKIDELTWAVITAMDWADSECPYYRVSAESITVGFDGAVRHDFSPDRKLLTDARTI